MSRKSYKDALKEVLGDRPVAYHPIISKALGSVKAGVMLSQLLYWNGGRIAADNDGWFYKMVSGLYDETGLTKGEQRTARTRLVDAGLIQTSLRGSPPRYYYKINMDNVAEFIGQFVVNGKIFQRLGNLPDESEDTLPSTDAKPARPIQETIQKTKAIDPIMILWADLFPNKRQPQQRVPMTGSFKTLSGKADKRMKDAEFQEGWEDALRKAARSDHLQTSGWFQLEYFLRNDANWLKIAGGTFDGFDDQNGTQPKTIEETTGLKHV